MNFLETIPSAWIAWLSFAGFVVMGALALYGNFDSRKRERQKDENATEDRVINLLKQEVEQLTKKVGEQGKDIEKLTTKVTALERENETLVKVLQGRDEQTQKFYSDAYVAMKEIGEIGSIAKTNNELIQKLVITLDAYFKTK